MRTEAAFTLQQASVTAQLPVFICDLSTQVDQLRLAREALDELRSAYPDATPSNVRAAYMSPWQSHGLNPKLEPLCQSVATLGRYCAQLIGGRDLAELHMGMAVTDCWGAIYERGDLALRHNHFPADFSAVVYLEAQAHCAPLVFAGAHVVQPSAGMLVLFPGLLDHEVPATPGRRVVIAMNLNKTAQIPAA